MGSWRRGHTDATMVGPRIVVHVWAGGDADVKSRVVLVVEDGVVEVVLRIDVVEFGVPKVSVASVGRCGWAEEGDVRTEDRGTRLPGTFYRWGGGERQADTCVVRFGNAEEGAIMVLDDVEVLD